MSDIEKTEVGVSHIEREHSHKTTEIREVQNVALADATMKANLSPWTGRMFKVSTLPIAQTLLQSLTQG